MKSVPKESIRNAVIMTIVTILATVLVAKVDVQPVGVEGTNIGFAKLNTGFFNKIGESHGFYVISTVTGAICFAVAAELAVIFLKQFIRRKSLQAVDRNLTCLMIMYLATVIIYLVFKRFAINYRPVLRDKGLESSYPSTHAMIAWVIMVSAIDQWNIYIKNEKLRNAAVTASFLILALVIVSRTLAGVHWLTDIIGGILFGDMLVTWYRAALTKSETENPKQK